MELSTKLQFMNLKSTFLTGATPLSQSLPAALPPQRRPLSATSTSQKATFVHTPPFRDPRRITSKLNSVAAELRMTEVILHVYDVTNSGNDKTNNTIMQINKIFKDGIGLGGIFHSAVQVYGDEEWSFGFCEQGTGVFHCPSTQNPMYTYRESIKLGETAYSVSKINQIIRELSREWPGESYDLLAKNCNHFCDEFCERLGVSKLPGWVNRFANAGDTAVEIAGNTAYRFRQAKTEIVTASKVAYRFLAGLASNTAPDSPSNSNGGTPRFQPTWFKNLVTPGAKPSSSSEVEDEDQDVIIRQQRQDAEAPSRLDYGRDI